MTLLISTRGRDLHGPQKEAAETSCREDRVIFTTPARCFGGFFLLRQPTRLPETNLQTPAHPRHQTENQRSPRAANPKRQARSWDLSPLPTEGRHRGAARASSHARKRVIASSRPHDFTMEDARAGGALHSSSPHQWQLGAVASLERAG